jgi:hypothetical protein
MPAIRSASIWTKAYMRWHCCPVKLLQ